MIIRRWGSVKVRKIAGERVPLLASNTSRVVERARSSSLQLQTKLKCLALDLIL